MRSLDIGELVEASEWEGTEHGWQDNLMGSMMMGCEEELKIWFRFAEKRQEYGNVNGKSHAGVLYFSFLFLYLCV